MPTDAGIDIELTPKQRYLLQELADVDSVLYGGQAGGGKSEGLLAFALQRRMQYPGSYGLLLRRTYPELEKSLIRKSYEWFGSFAKPKNEGKEWRFANGSIQEFGYCGNEQDVYQYQSAEYDDIGFDEASHFTEFQLIYMQSRLRPRSAPKGLIRYASNPGNIGHGYLKANFVDVARDKVYTDQHGRTRYFLPAALGDNTLMSKHERDEYQLWLSTLPERERKQLEQGDWDYVPGAVFSELDRRVHGIDPADPPDWLNTYFDVKTMTPRQGINVFRVGDWGYAKPFAYFWAFSTYDGRIVVFKEWYGCRDDGEGKNIGLKLITREQAKHIKQYEQANKIIPNLMVCDASIWDRPQSQSNKAERLPSDAEIFAEEGVYWDRDTSKMAKRSRKQGTQQMHDRLRLDGDSKPGLYIFLTCTNFWRTVPVLQPDKLDPDCYDTDMEDHAADPIRYLCSARPYKSTIASNPPPPLSMPWLMAYKNRFNAPARRPI